MRLLLGALRLYVYRALWYWLGIASAGRALVKALGSPDENIRSIAGILLIKSGNGLRHCYWKRVNRRENLPTVLDSSRIDRRPGTHPATSTIHERSQSRRFAKGSARSAKSNRVLYQDLTNPIRSQKSCRHFAMSPRPAHLCRGHSTND